MHVLGRFGWRLFLVAIGCGLGLPGAAQPSFTVNPSTGQTEYVEVVAVEGLSADALFQRVLQVADTLVRDQRPLQLDTAARRLAVLGAWSREDRKQVDDMPLGRYLYQLTVEAREGRYRYVVVPVMYELARDDRRPPRQVRLPIRPDEDLARGHRNQIESAVPRLVQAFAADLKAGVLRTPKTAPKSPAAREDW